MTGKLLRYATGAAIAIMAALPARAETLTDALIFAYRHSGLVEQQRAVLRAADEDVAQAVALLRPVVEYSLQAQRTYTFQNRESATFNTIAGPQTQRVGGADFEDTATASLTGSLLLYDGGASRLAQDVARETVLATRLGLTQVEQQVLGNAVSVYLAVQRAQAFVELGQSNVELIGRELEAARERFEVGEVTRTDVAIAESQLAAARSNLAASIGDLETAQANYLQVTGREPGTLADIGSLPQLPASLEAAQAVARRTHPEILADMRSVTVQELNVLRAEAAFRPRVSANAGMSVDQDFNESAQFGLGVSGPIYSGGAQWSQVRQAVAQRDQSRAALHVTVDEILQLVAQNWAQLSVARAQIESSQLQVRAARVAFEGLQEEASLGARTTLDVLDAEQDLRDARANLISAQISEISSTYAILQSVGLLTVDHLNLGIVTYDPSAYYDAVEDAPVGRVSREGKKLDRLLESLGR